MLASPRPQVTLCLSPITRNLYQVSNELSSGISHPLRWVVIISSSLTQKCCWCNTTFHQNDHFLRKREFPDWKFNSVIRRAWFKGNIFFIGSGGGSDPSNPIPINGNYNTNADLELSFTKRKWRNIKTPAKSQTILEFQDRINGVGYSPLVTVVRQRDHCLLSSGIKEKQNKHAHCVSLCVPGLGIKAGARGIRPCVQQPTATTTTIL